MEAAANHTQCIGRYLIPNIYLSIKSNQILFKVGNVHLKEEIINIIDTILWKAYDFDVAIFCIAVPCYDLSWLIIQIHFHIQNNIVNHHYLMLPWNP